ncbi:MAG: class I SAM-dependent methyltransferase [Betaproteobacteria bacterium]|nr:class I SAM-dependent methyltransferase [Betaproteobacteria bacterium]
MINEIHSGIPAFGQIDLEFARKYDASHAEYYFHKHQDGLARRLSNRREINIARRALALAGNPLAVLDLPCGAGRFWPMLLENPNRHLIAADNSQDMLDVALKYRADRQVARVQTIKTSAFAIDLPDGAVDSVFCIRLLHHIGNSLNRQIMLREFYRVAKESLVISLWVGGNFKAWKRKRLEARRGVKIGDYQNRFVIDKQTIESEFRQAGFAIAGWFDFIPGYAMWRVYVLKK